MIKLIKLKLTQIDSTSSHLNCILICYTNVTVKYFILHDMLRKKKDFPLP